MKQFIFSFGIHGSGHHMMNDILQPLLFDELRNQKKLNKEKKLEKNST